MCSRFSILVENKKTYETNIKDELRLNYAKAIKSKEKKKGETIENGYFLAPNTNRLVSAIERDELSQGDYCSMLS